MKLNDYDRRINELESFVDGLKGDIRFFVILVFIGLGAYLISFFSYNIGLKDAVKWKDENCIVYQDVNFCRSDN